MPGFFLTNINRLVNIKTLRRKTMAALFLDASELDVLAVLYDAEVTGTPPGTDPEKREAIDLLRRMNRDDLADVLEGVWFP